ncbi:MAG: hypothetical protein L3J28_08440, partial [Candidatus Polarisedimenticolaceae bacterium]|nr:hypothetical protein [Candidatus Polarisedimenticolaceae bacterium]
AFGGMMATVLSDYPQNRSRGFMAAMSGWANGLGALFMILVLSQFHLSCRTRISMYESLSGDDVGQFVWADDLGSYLLYPPIIKKGGLDTAA